MLPIFAIASAVVSFLYAFGVLEDTEEVKWFPVALGLLALHFVIPVVYDRYRER